MHKSEKMSSIISYCQIWLFDMFQQFWLDAVSAGRYCVTVVCYHGSVFMFESDAQHILLRITTMFIQSMLHDALSLILLGESSTFLGK